MFKTILSKQIVLLAFFIFCSQLLNAQATQKNIYQAFKQIQELLENFQYQGFENELDSIVQWQSDFNPEQKALYNFYRGRQHFLWMNLHGSFYYLNKAKIQAEQLKDKTLFFKSALMQINLLNQMRRNLPNNENETNYQDAVKALANYEHPITLPQSASKYYSLIKYYKYIEPNNDSCLHYAYLYNKARFKENAIINTGYIHSYVIIADYLAKTQLKSNKLPVDYYNTVHKALNLAKEHNDSLVEPLIYDRVIKNFYKTNQLDSVEYYLNKFDIYCNKIDRSRIKSEIFYIQRNLMRLYAHQKLVSLKKNVAAVKKTNFNIYEATVNLLSLSSVRSQIVFEQLSDLEKAEESRIKNIRARNYIIIIILLSLLIIFYIFYLRRKAEFNLRVNKQLTENIKKQATIDTFSARLNGQEKERKKVAKELHDEVAANLAGLVHKLAVINTTSDTQKQTTLLSRTQSQLSFLYQKIRNLSHIMDMPELENHLFKDILEGLFEEYELIETFTFDYSLPLTDKLNNLNTSLKKHIFLLLQELLLNTHRHAQATLVKSNMEIIADEITLTFQDNGIGVSQNIIDTGFLSIKDRVKLIGGKLNISSKINEGTSIKMNIPLKTDL